MRSLSKKIIRSLALILVITILLTLIPFAIRNYNTEAAEVEEFSSADIKIAADISSMTGASTEEILQLKKQYGSWNDVLDKLKIDGESYGENNNVLQLVNIPNNIEQEDQGRKLGTPQLPELPIKDVKPKNPADEVMDEIRQISPVKDMR